jgi:hypothetical protein
MAGPRSCAARTTTAATSPPHAAPWRQGIEYDAGLFFIAYQRGPRTEFVQMFENMAKLDALNQYTTHVGSGLFACPGGIGETGYVGQSLFEAQCQATKGPAPRHRRRHP